MLKAIFYRGPSRTALHTTYAKAGRIDEQAPITSASAIVVAASVDQVWALVSNLPAWPTITPAFRHVRLETELVVDAYLRFTLNHFPIRARFAVVAPNRELTWTGSSLWFKAIDRIVLEALSARQTRLSIAESFAGLFAVPLMSRAQLQAQHEQWLQAFQRAAEQA
ncbi:MAG: SRPBCC family protein [Caldilineaceae bacterium]|nr:SRPBCC family protein [Caldilineaceae bacterium]